ncbi:MAG: DUF4942 domain-containing protein [Acidobacteriaceae bacterium]
MTDADHTAIKPQTQDHRDRGRPPPNMPALQKRLSEILDEYETKLQNIEEEASAFERAGDKLKSAACISGTWGDSQIDTGHVHVRTLTESLLKSAWLCVYNGLCIETIAPAGDKNRFKQAMANPPPFTIENIRATFGDYVANPRANILRGLAEAFCLLDPAYKSHDRVKIGVQGLPKRVILSYVNDYSGYGTERLKDVINALAAYQRKPLIEWSELRDILKDGESASSSRGITLKRFKNGNAHLHFSPETLLDINRALAEFYGDVLADCHEERPDRPRGSTAVSKDLQYYPTPGDVVARVLDELRLEGDFVLEPSCGCGRILDGLRERGAKAFGIEVDPARANQSRNKGHAVMTANFLEVTPTPKYDRVVMNPPFYGTHYAKHVQHARKFLKPDGVLTAILPITARYDHGLVEGHWSDLPLGSFRDSGTNINTTVLTIRKKA